MKKIIGCGCLLFILVLISGGYFAWRMLSGVGKTKDLGISVTQAQALQAREKIQVAVEALPIDTAISQSIRYEGTKPMTYSMDSTELTALALAHSSYKYFPFRNIQIRINADGSLEISCIADTDKALEYATAIGFASSDLDKVMTEYKIPRASVPMYIHGSGSVVDGKSTINLKSAEISGIPVPMALVNDKKSAIEGIIDEGISRTPGLQIKSLTFENGQMYFDGMSPDKKYIVEK